MAGTRSGGSGAGTTVTTVAVVAGGRLRFSQVSLEKSTRGTGKEQKSGRWGWSHRLNAADQESRFFRRFRTCFSTRTRSK
jgi:hypothetical protein